ncbi:MAG: hypothetical protein DVB28_001394 [Verrucomicrobia bacterium]|nr:MAG: hypothetical protein DVB28_001394 [Verrucomicrobiota bacterium]
MRFALALSLLASFHAAFALPPEDRAREHLSEITAIFPAQGWKASPPLLVSQAPGQLYESGLPPVWKADLVDERGRHGYLLWENSPRGTLLEFALDSDSETTPKGGGLTPGVPALQQFPVPGLKSANVASGCVPTAGASLVGYWTTHGFPEWAGPALQPLDLRLKSTTLRLRKRMRMAEMPDTSGYTDDGMPLSGAFPQELASSIEKDAQENAVPMSAKFSQFSFEHLKQETAAFRPVLLSCMVRLPQKPHLSWGHEVVGVGWLELGGEQYAGVKDNFYPSESPQTVRWIRQEAFQSLIRVQPEKPGEEK